MYKLAILFVLFALTPLYSNQGLDELLQKANKSMEDGLTSTSLLDRKRAFNQTLTLYHELEQQFPSSAALNGALGDAYFQLGEYAWALLYYYRALEFEPHNELIRQHLQLAQTAVGLSLNGGKKSLDNFLSFNGFFSLGDRLNIFFVSILFLIIFVSLAIWFSNKWWKICSYTALFLTSFFLINIFLSFYFSRIEGVMIFPSGLYRHPDVGQAQLVYNPLVKGLKVVVLGQENKGEWLKIETPEKDIGYVPYTSIRII